MGRSKWLIFRGEWYLGNGALCQNAGAGSPTAAPCFPRLEE